MKQVGQSQDDLNKYFLDEIELLRNELTLIMAKIEFDSEANNGLSSSKSRVNSALGKNYKKLIEDLSLSIPKIRHVDQLQVSDKEILSRFKRLWIYKIYRKFFYRSRFIRQMVEMAWRTLFPLYVKTLNKLNYTIYSKNKFPLVSFLEWASAYGIDRKKYSDKETLLTPFPRYFPQQAKDVLITPHQSYIFPEIYMCSIPVAVVTGGSNLIKTSRGVIHHDLYDFTTDYTSEELHGRNVIDPANKSIYWLVYDGQYAYVPVAATFLDACAVNYAHWITEVLPKLALFCLEDAYKDIPIIVNDGLHHNIMASIIVLAGQREVITLPVGRELKVGKLYSLSTIGYVPFDRRRPDSVLHNHGMFSPFALKRMSGVIKNQLKIKEGNAEKIKIFIRRNSGARKCLNANEIEGALVKRGFLVISPEELTFSEQVELFSKADIVVGATGAALANMVFCEPQAKVVILVANCNKLSYWYWQNIACATGLNFTYVVARENQTQIHDDYIIELQDVLCALDEFKQN